MHMQPRELEEAQQQEGHGQPCKSSTGKEKITLWAPLSENEPFSGDVFSKSAFLKLKMFCNTSVMAEGCMR